MKHTKKVFLVTLQYRGYVLADDDFDAEDIGLSIAQDERPSVEVEEVRSNVLRWPNHACVYHAEQMDRDITVAECFPAPVDHLSSIAVNSFLSDLFSFLGEVAIFSVGVLALTALMFLIAQLAQ